MIGLVIEDVSNPFYSVVVRGIEEVTRQRGYLLLVASSDEDPAKEREVVSAFCSRRVDALIVVPAGNDHAFLASELAAGTAVVFVDRPGDVGKADSVVTANADGARRAVEHLADHGHRRIAYIGDVPGIWTADERHRGYLEALAGLGVAPEPDLVRVGAQTVEAAERETAALLALPEAADRDLRGQQPRHRRCRAGAEAPTTATWPWSDSTTSSSPTPWTRRSRSSPRTSPRSAAPRPSSCSRASTARRGPARLVTLDATLIVRGSGEIPPR